MRTLLLSFALLLAGLLPAQAASLRLENGDLLFVTAASTGLSGAINDATGRQGTVSYDHVALIAQQGEATAVLHADEKGSREQPLSAFLAEAKARHRTVVVYRLQGASRSAIPDAVARARTLLGKPYNVTYVQDEDSYYCSDFIERAFRAHQVFATQPMNFRNLQTGEISPYWVAFYRARGMEVPQGAPGTNPNDMSAAPVLARIGTLD